MQSLPFSEELMWSVCLAEGVGGLFHDSWHPVLDLVDILQAMPVSEELMWSAT